MREEPWEGLLKRRPWQKKRPWHLATNAVLCLFALLTHVLWVQTWSFSWLLKEFKSAYNQHNSKEMKNNQCVLQIRDLVQHGTWQQEAGCCLERKGGKGEFLFRLFLVGSWMCSFKPSSIPWTMYLQVSSRMDVWLFWNSLNIRVPSSFSSLWMGAGTSAGWLRCSTGSTTTAVQGSGPKTSGKVTIGSKITWYLCKVKLMRHWKTLGKLH